LSDDPARANLSVACEPPYFKPLLSLCNARWRHYFAEIQGLSMDVVGPAVTTRETLELKVFGRERLFALTHASSPPCQSAR